MPSLLQVWALPVALLATANISMTWYHLVSKHVPDPYLDEFFHVPQAQRYCRGDFSWDPKITTPPGLYLASLALKVVAGCEISTLRALNVGAICLICLLSYSILRVIHNDSSKPSQRAGKNAGLSRIEPQDDNSTLNAHSALNISLFPPLFFFSALYYTDVMSTLAVLLSYATFLNRSKTSSALLNSGAQILIGVIALLFRQTNIFWVAIFPAAMAVVDAYGEDHQMEGDNNTDMKFVCRKSWTNGALYDCAVDTAGPQDLLLFTLSFVLVVLRKPFLLLATIAPYAVLVALFAGFVVWNGSVVLGDKSAHTATLHLPQMLYFWPYIAFFSFPLIIGPFLSLVTKPLPRGPRTFFDNIFGQRKTTTPTFVTPLVVIIIGLATVHFNTIIHPYTLADNRHYVFYVFRVLRRHPAIKYAAVPVYYVCSWMVIHALGTESESEAPTKQNIQKTPSTSDHSRPQSCKISFVVAFVGTTALSVVTAPLVEPRYFIIPWIIWRLHTPYLPRWRTSIKSRFYDLRLVLETVWLLLINTALGYNFLYRGFSWPQEPGNIQRFLW